MCDKLLSECSFVPVQECTPLLWLMCCVLGLQGDCEPKDLVGKPIFNFGPHKKGGGCDFYVPIERIKFHSQLVVHPSGRITIGFCNAQVCYLLTALTVALPASTGCSRLPGFRVHYSPRGLLYGLI
jgi:hypothetical protein